MLNESRNVAMFRDGSKSSNCRRSVGVVTFSLVAALAFGAVAEEKEKEIAPIESSANEGVSEDSAVDTAPVVSAAEDEENTRGTLSEDGDNESNQEMNQDLQQRMAALEEENAFMQERLDGLEEAQMRALSGEANELKIYGFVDVQWAKYFIEEGSFYDGYFNGNNSFSTAHWNLYIDKKLGQSFRVMGEVRFLFQPYGDITAYGNRIDTNAQFERAQTRTSDWLDAYYFDWGGISIQRLWIEYKLNDYFGVRAGHYLTPYGNWNVDHASTVVIPAHKPFLNSYQLMAESQTGLYLFGRAFPSESITIDYGLTVSNGRGPTQKLYDLDENKAIGLKFEIAYNGPLSISTGGYIYWGDATDSQVIVTWDDETDNMDIITERNYNYTEKSMAFHLKLEMFGVLLQGEYVGSLIEYDDNHRESYQITGFDPMEGLYVPDYAQHAAYGLLAYRLPLESVNITPYFVFEYQRPDRLQLLPIGNSFAWGINWRIIPSVVFKVEGLHHRHTDSLGGDYSAVVTQLAVSY